VIFKKIHHDEEDVREFVVDRGLQCQQEFQIALAAMNDCICRTVKLFRAQLLIFPQLGERRNRADLLEVFTRAQQLLRLAPFGHGPQSGWGVLYPFP